MHDLCRTFMALLLAWPAWSAAASPLSLSCMGCHQSSVNAPRMPSLNGFPAERIAASLRQSRDNPQLGSIMTRFTSKLSDAEIDALAAELGRHSK